MEIVLDYSGTLNPKDPETSWIIRAYRTLLSLLNPVEFSRSSVLFALTSFVRFTLSLYRKSASSGWRIREYIKKYCHYEERSDEVIHSHTCIFWIATKIFDFLAMTSVCVILNKNCHPEKTKKQAVKQLRFLFCSGSFYQHKQDPEFRFRVYIINYWNQFTITLFSYKIDSYYR